MCYIGEEVTDGSIHTKFLNYPKCRYVIAHLTSGTISIHEAASGDCRSKKAKAAVLKKFTMISMTTFPLQYTCKSHFSVSRKNFRGSMQHNKR